MVEIKRQFSFFLFLCNVNLEMYGLNSKPSSNSSPCINSDHQVV